LSAIKDVVKQAIAYMPETIKVGFLRLMSSLSPSMRTKMGYRIALVVSFYTKTSLTVTTSMGISRDYRYEVSATFAPGIAWGKPQFDDQEWHSMLLAGHLSKECDCFIDVGSYIGYYVLYVRAITDESKPIFYFEPIPEYFQLIQQNVTRNHLNNVTGFNKAVSDSTGHTTFYRNNTHSTCGSLTDRYVNKHAVQEITVETISFDDFVSSCGLSDICIKIDIEGAEHLFLKGAAHSLNRVRYIVIEVLDVKSDFLKEMKIRGYEVYHITARGLVHCPTGTDVYIPGQWNWLICDLKPEQLRDKVQQIGLEIVEQTSNQVDRS